MPGPPRTPRAARAKDDVVEFVAAELYLGLQTVKTHVGNVLGKLGARDRTQAVIRAYESGFVKPTG